LGLALRAKFVGAYVLLSATLVLSSGFSAPLRNQKINGPTAVATAANVSYCFARVRGLEADRQPQSYLVLRLRVRVSYLNEGTRTVILPLERQRTIYTALKPGQMSEFKQGLGLFDPVLKPMDHLPPGVGADSPIDPKNDVFTVIPAGGEMTPQLLEEVNLPVDRKGLFRKYPDLRGHRVYVKFRYEHRELAPGLEAQLSDRWSRFGLPWTGTLTTNTILIDVPAAPQGEPCKDLDTPAHAAVDEEDKK
jgi:hypothetical protein